MSIIFTVMSYGGLALAVVCLIVVVILFIKWDIPKVFGEITGSTQKKAIEKIRKEGYEPNASKKSSIKSNTDSEAIKVRKTNTDELTGGHTGKTSELPEEEMTQSTDSVHRGGLTTQENVTNTIFHVYQPGEEETTVLGSEAEAEEQTTVLSSEVGMEAEEQTTVLSSEAGTEAEEQTTVLGAEAGTEAEEQTTVLSSEAGMEAEEQTTVLSSEAGTEAEEQTTVLSSGAGTEAEEQTTVLSSEAGREAEEQTTVLSSETEAEEQTTVLSATAVEEQTTVLQNIDSNREKEIHQSEESTTILTSGGVEEVINIPDEVYTQPGSVMKVLDFVVTHTDEVIA